ncbi:protein of unknown function [Candidatus Nitrospira inopinata]|uniref:Uncharacterized protein n=1 Tax=Candidatus Nitrospira inopinata TaxID=1715989 RepID=A0A0S4KV48_9BACT|nr:protein of unknown function [Candidatus Nitrospira inopinata]
MVVPVLMALVGRFSLSLKGGKFGLTGVGGRFPKAPSIAGTPLSSRWGHFFRYTFSPTFSWRFGTATLPSVEAMMIVLPEAEGPNSLERSTLIVRMVPSTVISTFFMAGSFHKRAS